MTVLLKLNKVVFFFMSLPLIKSFDKDKRANPRVAYIAATLLTSG